MISVERYEELAGEILDTLPPAFFEQLNAGVVVSEERKLHPESREGSPLYILGEYTRSGLGHGVTLYYGSFAATCGDLPEERQREELRKIIAHEFRHHMEWLSGTKELEDEDRVRLAKYRARFGRRGREKDKK